MHSSHMLREGASPEVVRDILGHANIEVTQNVYPTDQDFTCFFQIRHDFPSKHHVQINCYLIGAQSEIVLASVDNHTWSDSVWSSALK
jgi:hypothetical protein